MHKHSSLKRGNDFSAKKSLWPDYAIEVDPYRLPAHMMFEVPKPVFSSVPVNRSVSIYNSFVVITDMVGQQSKILRIVALEDFDAIVVRVGFSAHGYRQIGSAVYLHHEKLGFELPLYAAPDCHDTAAYWNSWSRVLGLPAMTVAEDGSLVDPFDRVGKLHVCETVHRRTYTSGGDYRPAFRRQTALQQRRMINAGSLPAIAGTGSANQENGSNVYRLFS